MLGVGHKFPAFSLQATVSTEKGKSFQTISDNDFTGKWKVYFFWPKDFTFVCPTEIAAFGNHAVIIVNPAKELQRLPGVQLVPIGNGRALISLEPPYSVPQLELDLRDAIDRGDTTETERQTLVAIADILRQSRRSRRVTLEERTIIVLESKRQYRRS